MLCHKSVILNWHNAQQLQHILHKVNKMKFSHSLISTALFAACSFNAFAADITIYGKANVSAQSSDEGEGSFTEIKSNASRIGFKGTHTLTDEMEVIYQAEFQVDLDGDGDTFSQRNQYIGLQGNFGQVLLGKNDTVLKQSQGKVDLFSDLNGDIKALWKGENRMSDTLTYKSPKFSGLQLGVTYIAEDSVDAEDAYSIALFYGDKKLKKSKVYAALAMDSEVKGYDTMRATIQSKVAGVVLGAIYHTQESTDGTDMDGFLVSAKYGLDKFDLKAQIQTAEYDGGDDRSGFTVGADYKLSSQAKIFGFYSSFDMDSKADQDYLALGLEYKF